MQEVWLSVDYTVERHGKSKLICGKVSFRELFSVKTGFSAVKSAEKVRLTADYPSERHAFFRSRIIRAKFHF